MTVEVEGCIEGETLSQDALGRVVAGRLEDGGLDVAVRRVTARALVSDPEALTRIRSTAGALAASPDPRLVRVLWFGADASEIVLLTDRVDGVSLQRLSPLPAEASAVVAHDLAAAAGTLHQLGVVHGWPSPGAVRVMRDGQVRLVDAGLALPVGSDDPQNTAPYRAPELWREAPLSASTDVYALACLTVELVARHRAVMGATVEDLRSGHLAEGEHQAALSEPLLAVVRRGLSATSDDRPRDGASFAADLGDALDSVYGPGWKARGREALSLAVQAVDAPAAVAALSVTAEPAPPTPVQPTAATPATSPPPAALLAADVAQAPPSLGGDGSPAAQVTSEPEALGASSPPAPSEAVPEGAPEADSPTAVSTPDVPAPPVPPAPAPAPAPPVPPLPPAPAPPAPAPPPPPPLAAARPTSSPKGSALGRSFGWLFSGPGGLLVGVVVIGSLVLGGLAFAKSKQYGPFAPPNTAVLPAVTTPAFSPGPSGPTAASSASGTDSTGVAAGGVTCGPDVQVGDWCTDRGGSAPRLTVSVDLSGSAGAHRGQYTVVAPWATSCQSVLAAKRFTPPGLHEPSAADAGVAADGTIFDFRGAGTYRPDVTLAVIDNGAVETFDGTTAVVVMNGDSSGSLTVTNFVSNGQRTLSGTLVWTCAGD